MSAQQRLCWLRLCGCIFVRNRLRCRRDFLLGALEQGQTMERHAPQICRG